MRSMPGTKAFVVYRLVMDNSLIIDNNKWLINWLPIDYCWLLIDFIDVIDIID